MPCSCRHLNITASDVENLTNHSHNKMTINPPKQAKVVICGAGVMGAAVAYQLANIGLGPETVILEQATYVYFYLFFTSSKLSGILV